MISPLEALDRLREGNRRFVAKRFAGPGAGGPERHAGAEYSLDSGVVSFFEEEGRTGRS